MSCPSSAVAVKRLTNTVRACKGNRGEIKYRHCLVRIDPVCKIPILSSRDPGRVLRGSGCLVGLHGIVLLVVLVLHAAGNLKVSCEFRNKLCVVGFFSISMSVYGTPASFIEALCSARAAFWKALSKHSRLTLIRWLLWSSGSSVSELTLDSLPFRFFPVLDFLCFFSFFSFLSFLSLVCLVFLLLGRFLGPSSSRSAPRLPSSLSPSSSSFPLQTPRAVMSASSSFFFKLAFVLVAGRLVISTSSEGSAETLSEPSTSQRCSNPANAMAC